MIDINLVKTAKNIGSTLALKSVSIGLVIVYIIMIPLNTLGQESLIDGLFWIVKWMGSEFSLHFIIGIAAFYACRYYFGGRAGIDILIKQRSYKFVGPLYGFFTLLSTAFLASLTGFFMGVKHDLHYLDTMRDLHLDFFKDHFIDYIFKPMFWFLIFGFIPAMLVGLWFGWGIKKKGK